MGESLTGDGDFEDGAVSEVCVLVIALLGGPVEDVQCKVHVGLGPQGCVHVDWGEPGFEVVYPCFELFVEWDTNYFRVRV